MIQIERWSEPDHLTQNRPKWLAAFLKRRATNPKARPPSRQYGHEKIRTILHRMSGGKCFYCERKLQNVAKHVEHYIDVALNPNKAFDWNNLYFSCEKCNLEKASEKACPIADCIDPCGDVDPKRHLTFSREFIRPLNDSQLGRNTIQKYKLDRDELDHMRLRELINFYERLESFRRRNHPLTKSQKERLRSYMQRESAFSLMFQVYLQDHVDLD